MSLEVLEVLIEAEADMSAENNYGSTAYTYAKNNPALFGTDNMTNIGLENQ